MTHINVLVYNINNNKMTHVSHSNFQHLGAENGRLKSLNFNSKF